MRITSLLERIPYGRVLNDSKDHLLSLGIKDRLNHLVKPYGTMLDFHLNTTDRSISISAQLKGEQSPISVTIKEYEIVCEEGKTYVRFPNVQTSREWLTTLAREKLAFQKIPLPDHVSWFTQLLD